MSVRIEIQEQPERRRLFAEVEAGRVARRKLVTHEMTGDLAADLDAHWGAIKAALGEMLPELEIKRLRRAEQPALASLPAAPQPEPEIVVTRDNLALKARHVDDPEPVDMDALRAEAEAAGVDVDKRWGEARLRKEIAAAGDERTPKSD